jgi:mono/diheme cytochrome c family protein
VAAAAALCLSSCRGREHPGRAIDPAVATIAAERAGLGEPGVRGKILYASYCAVCHGETGAGDGFNSSNLGVPPPDLRQEVATRGEALVAKVVREGSASIGKSPLCPPYGRLLDDADRQLIVAYVREGLRASGAATAAGK